MARQRLGVEAALRQIQTLVPPGWAAPAAPAQTRLKQVRMRRILVLAVLAAVVSPPDDRRLPGQRRHHLAGWRSTTSVGVLIATLASRCWRCGCFSLDHPVDAVCRRGFAATAVSAAAAMASSR